MIAVRGLFESFGHKHVILNVISLGSDYEFTLIGGGITGWSLLMWAVVSLHPCDTEAEHFL